MNSAKTFRAATFASMLVSFLGVFLMQRQESDIFAYIAIVGGILTIFFGVKTFVVSKNEADNG